MSITSILNRQMRRAIQEKKAKQAAQQKAAAEAAVNHFNTEQIKQGAARNNAAETARHKQAAADGTVQYKVYIRKRWEELQSLLGISGK